MKKLFKIAGLVLITAMLAACSNGSSSDSDSDNGKGNSSGPNTMVEETFSKTTVFNPNTTTVKLIAQIKSRSADDVEEVCEVEPLETADVELGSEHEYYFTDADGNKIADLAKSDSGQYLPVYLELNEPKDGKEYLLLNQYKNDTILESFTRYPSNGQSYETYGLLLYEVVNADDLNAYKYNADTYIRIYPSANYWIDSKGYASNKIGTKITYNDEFKNNFSPLSDSWVAWGWSTKNEDLDMWFCHRVVSYVLHAEDGDSYEVKNNIEEQASISTTIQAVYSENPNWSESWSVGLPSTETTKWKVTEIWFYSTQKLYYVSELNENGKKLEKILQEKIPECKLMLFPKDRDSYSGWMPQNCKYALCVRLESKNCNVKDAWCETIETSVLKEAYDKIIDSAQDFILNY